MPLGLSVPKGFEPTLTALFADAAHGTPAEHATLIMTARGSRPVCIWRLRWFSAGSQDVS